MTAPLSANAAARALSTKSRTITAKMVRTKARAIIARFDKVKHPEYQAHAYSAAEMATLRKAFAASGSRAAAQPARKATKPRTAKPRVTKPQAEA